MRQAAIAIAVEERVRAALVRELAQVPADQECAVLLDATRSTAGAPDVQAMFATRTEKAWSVGEGIEWTRGRHIEGEIVLAGTFNWSDFSCRR